jgi:predicted DNA-binding transcriptional regulator AlpA
MNPNTETRSHSKTSRPRDTSLYGLGTDDRLIKLNEVKALTGYGATSIYNKIKHGLFPAPVKLDMIGGSRWPLGEIRQFNADAIAARDHGRETVSGYAQSAKSPWKRRAASVRLCGSEGAGAAI